MLSEFLRKFPSAVSNGRANGLLQCKNPVSPLDQANFPNIKFWTKRLFRKACQETIGDTNALSTTKKK